MWGLKRKVSGSVLATPARGNEGIGGKMNRARPSVELLERREGPASLDFVNPASMLGVAWLNDAQAAAVVSLASSHTGFLAEMHSSPGLVTGQAYSSLQYGANLGDKTIDVTTHALALNSSFSAAALAQTTMDGSSFQSVAAKINPSANGEYRGEKCHVTFTVTWISSISPSNLEAASNSCSFFVNGKQYFGGTDSATGTHTTSTTVTVNSYIGATVNIAFRDYSAVGALAGGAQNSPGGSGVQNSPGGSVIQNAPIGGGVANSELMIGMSVRTY